MAEGNGRVPGVEARAGKFPGPSLIPPLTAIQREHGWLPREQLVALSRDWRRPLYEIEGLISFYPHFRTSPPEPLEVAVCRDLSCWLARGRAEIPDGATVHEVSCVGRCDQAPVAIVEERYPEARRGTGRRPNDPYAQRGASTTATYREFGDDPVPILDDSGLKGMGGAGFPTGQEVGDGPRPGRPDQVRHLQRRRGRARHVQGPPDPGRAAAPRDRGHADRDAHGRRPAGLGVHPPRVRARGAADARGARARAGRRAARGRLDRRLHLARRLHPGRGDRAAGVHGGPPRRAAEQAAVPGRLRAPRPADADEQRRDVRRDPDHPRARCPVVEGPGHQRRCRAEVRRDLRARRTARRVLRAGRHADLRADRARRRRA